MVAIYTKYGSNSHNPNIHRGGKYFGGHYHHFAKVNHQKSTIVMGITNSSTKRHAICHACKHAVIWGINAWYTPFSRDKKTKKKVTQSRHDIYMQSIKPYYCSGRVCRSCVCMAVHDTLYGSTLYGYMYIYIYYNAMPILFL